MATYLQDWLSGMPSADSDSLALLEAIQSQRSRIDLHFLKSFLSPEEFAGVVMEDPLTPHYRDVPGMHEGWLKHFTDVAQRGHSNHQNLLMHSILCDRYQTVAPIAARNNPNIASWKPPVVGTYHGGQINGATVAWSESHPMLLLVDEGALTFAHYAAGALAPIVSKNITFSADGRPQDLRGSVEVPGEEEWTAAARLILQAYLALLEHGSPMYAKPFLPEESSKSTYVLLRDAFELFLVAHEIAHISLGHVQNMFLKEKRGNEPLHAFRWAEEYAADDLAHTLTIQSLATYGCSEGIAIFLLENAIDWFVYLEGIVTLAIHGPGKGVLLPQDHPPFHFRGPKLGKKTLEFDWDHQSAKALLDVARLNNGLHLAVGGKIEMARKMGLQVHETWNAYRDGFLAGPDLCDSLLGPN